ncbi:MAG: ribose 5-phosphate isomerase B [Fimbriimonadales bacterium]|nr:ribose 5-phosphate isomerase B [Fimbriimonadales bacterium]
MRIAVGTDHAGFPLAVLVAEWLKQQGHEVEWHGADSPESYDYPDAARSLCAAVLRDPSSLGILVCGSGIGMSIAANRIRGVRAALCCSEEMAELARRHNHANVLCLGARLTDADRARRILEAFLRTEPDRDERHARRVAKLDDGVDRLKADS